MPDGLKVDVSDAVNEVDGWAFIAPRRKKALLALAWSEAAKEGAKEVLNAFSKDTAMFISPDHDEDGKNFRVEIQCSFGTVHVTCDLKALLLEETLVEQQYVERFSLLLREIADSIGSRATHKSICY